jgi:hypothetical protein
MYQRRVVRLASDQPSMKYPLGVHMAKRKLYGTKFRIINNEYSIHGTCRNNQKQLTQQIKDLAAQLLKLGLTHN